MSEPTLYLYPGRNGLPSPSPPCTKVVLALKYSQLPHTLEKVKADPRGVSPTGRLPAFKLGDEVLSDSVRILDRLEQLDPPRKFWPEDPRERARDRVWEKLANEHFYWRGVYLRWVPAENAKRTVSSLLPRLPPPIRWILPIVAKRSARGRAVGQGIGLFDLERVREDVTGVLDLYEAGLGEGPFLEERSAPGRADLAAAGHLPQMTYEGITPWAGEQLMARPKLLDYVARVYEACGVDLPECVKR